MKESEGKKSLATEEIERDLHRFSFVMYSAVQRHANIKNAAFNSDTKLFPLPVRVPRMRSLRLANAFTGRRLRLLIPKVTAVTFGILRYLRKRDRSPE